MPQALARWATLEDAEYEVEFDHQEVVIRPDAGSTTWVENQSRILKEGARHSVGLRRLYYTPATTTIKILSAKSILDGKEYPVKLSQIEDKPLASRDKAFDETRQIMIAFPKTEIGARIYLKYSVVEKPAIKNLYRASFGAGDLAPERNSTLKITSARPLYFQVNDPDKLLNFTEVQKEGTHEVKISLAKTPVYRKVVEEDYAQVNPERMSWIEISTLKDWAELADVAEYEKILTAPLPPLYEEIRKKAEKLGTPVEKINAVTAELASMITYVGDWRTIRGGYFPRALAEVAETRHADCKDFAAGTVAILRKLGFRAHLALVRRGYALPFETPSDLPGGFNHAIVRAFALEDKADYWVDPTNFASYAQGIFPDIENRRSLVLTEPTATLERIPANTSRTGQSWINRRVRVVPNSPGFDRFTDRFQVTTDLKIAGTQALRFTGATLKGSQSALNRQIMKAYSDFERSRDWKLVTPDLADRTVREVDFRMEHTEDSALRTSAGAAFRLYGHMLYPITAVEPETRIADLYLGTPELVSRETLLEGLEKIGSAPLDCKVETPWFEAARRVTDSPEGIKITDLLAIKATRIPNAELKTSAFAKQKRELMTCFEGTSLVYQAKRKPYRGLASEKR
ncbi:MAG: hypothetical protein A2Z97_06285 [Bdellovibrionales bacterium GWB1_52_6]|nr:MAG: hypothetical protein A2Z97_06285 [Bdellovibrionales bacterium GWB1_52_6]OFZ06110.1 MAG: hypothetical protein A2X97_02125 [Bdellovibrionales bacterium GWA1_52_35]